MNALEFISSLIDSIVWPAAIIVLVFAFRAPLRKVLQELSGLRFGDFEMDFGPGIKRIGDQAKKIGLESPKRPISARAGTLDSSQIIADALQLTREFPEPAVILAWTAVEHELLQAIMRLAISPDYPAYNSAHKNIMILREQGYLDRDTCEILDGMRNLRNAAAHPAIAGARVLSNEAAEFVVLTGAVTERLKNFMR